MTEEPIILSPIRKNVEEGPKSRVWPYAIVVALSAIGVACSILYPLSPPSDFPLGQTFIIEKGETFDRISADLSSKHFIRSSFVLAFIAKSLGRDRSAVSGEYMFDRPLWAFEVLSRLNKGDHGIQEITVTIPEGFDRKDIAERFSLSFPNFSTKEFLAISTKDEGYLFPDTYTFYQNADAKTVYTQMKENFAERTATLRKDIEAAGKSFSDVVILASIVEKEVAGTNDRRTVAGIFLRRMDLGMPLQADATFTYINGKVSSELTGDDLKLDSPYNTYLHKGLPPTPISSPGLEALEAVSDPLPSKYLYYLSDRTGTTHYARTFEEHKLNKERYLR